MPDQTPDTPAPNFEQSLTRLDEIARSLEDNKLGLQESLAVYEEGVKLLRQCKSMLQTAERQVEVLTGFDAAGNPVTTPFDDTATAVSAARSASANESTSVSPSTSDNPPAAKKSRKKTAASPKSQQVAPWEESTTESDDEEDESKIDEPGRLF